MGGKNIDITGLGKECGRKEGDKDMKGLIEMKKGGNG
jgi:hypothetical protein